MKIDRVMFYTPHMNITPAFGMMKASQFEGLDYTCMRQFKAPIEKFNGIKDFYNWAVRSFNKKSEKNLSGKTKETEEQRVNILRDWNNGLKNYSPAIALITISSLLKNLKPSNDNLPPVFYNKVFEETLADVEGAVALDKDFQFDISKLYKQHLKSMFLLDNSGRKIKDGWIEVSAARTNEEGSKNAELLNALSYKTWCTKGVKSEIYVKEFNFRILVKNGEPQVCIRLLDNTVCEIQGRLNDSKIPDEYKEQVMNYIENSGFDLDCDMEEELYGF